MCLALMMVVGAVASLNVALPEIARSTGASQTQLQWIVAAYALAFAALLSPRRCDRRSDRPQAGPRRRPRPLRPLLAGGDLPERPRRADRAPRRHGRRRGDDHARDAVGDHHRLPARGARQGRRDVGRRRRRRRRARPARLGRPARVASLAVDLRPQRRPRGRRARSGRSRSCRPPARRGRRGSTSSARSSRPRLSRRSSSASSKARARLGRADDGRRAGVRRRRSGGVRALGAAPPRADARPAALRPARLRRRNALRVRPVLRRLSASSSWRSRTSSS